MVNTYILGCMACMNNGCFIVTPFSGVLYCVPSEGAGISNFPEISSPTLAECLLEENLANGLELVETVEMGSWVHAYICIRVVHELLY